MPRLAVTFDTNIYRGLSPDPLKDLRIREQSASVIPVASIYGILELGAHLHTTEDPDRQHSVAALRRMWAHCRFCDGFDYSAQIAADPDDILAQAGVRKVRAQAQRDGGRAGERVACRRRAGRQRFGGLAGYLRPGGSLAGSSRAGVPRFSAERSKCPQSCLGGA